MKISVVIFILFVSVGLASGRSWWNRLFPQEAPQVIQNTQPAKPLVSPPPEVVNLQDSFAQVAQAVKPAVVNISAVQINEARSGDPHEFFFGDPQEFFHRFFGEKPREGKPREFRTEGTGSGVIIDPKGYILTNNHVIQNATQLTVTMSDGKSFRGKVIGSDERTDLAVIRIKSSNPFPYVPFGDSDNTRIGDWVLAIGSPFGLEQTVTAGIISAIRQTLNIEGKFFRGLLQTDAAINRGNSGGPLVNLRGEVVGINVAIFAPTGVFSGIGFAIPVNRAKLILSDLIEKGYVERSWMGVEIVDVDDVISRQFGLEKSEGALVNSVIPDSPAAKAGVKRGDVVIEFNKKKVKTTGDLQDVVSQTPPGKDVTLRVIRNGERKTLRLTTATMPSQVALGKSSIEREKPSEPKQTKWLGAQLSELTDAIRGKFGIDDDITKGIVLLDVPAKSDAADAGLRPGDVIRSINRKRINTLQDFEKIREGLKLKDGVVFDLLRRGRWMYVSYKTPQ